MHLVLSGEDPDIIIGNYIADHLRGNAMVNELPNSIKRGIMLHRAIDTFSDMHPAVRHSVRLLQASHHHYAPVAVDLLYDHFLIKNWKQFVRLPFHQTLQEFYSLLESRLDTLPPKSKKISLKILENNWFDKYETFEGMNEVFATVNRRTHYENELPHTVKYMIAFYNEFESDFLQFAPDIFTFVSLHTRYRL